MSRRERLKEESRIYSYAWENYSSRKRKHESYNYIYCFFEGDDDPKYYNNRIENITKKEVSHFICNGKEEVLKSIEAFKLKGEEGLLAFFIDKDFDDFLDISYDYNNLYITPCYAIENFYIGIEVFKKVLKTEFKINEDNNLYDKYIEIYENRQKEFHEIILEANSSIVLYHYLKKKGKYEENMNYQDIKIDKTIVNISFDSVNKKNNLNLLKKIKEFIDSSSEAKEKYKEFELKLNQDPKCNFRGKYELQFLNKFLNLLQGKLDSSFKIDEKNIISNLSQYAITDDKLEEFLNLITKKE